MAQLILSPGEHRTAIRKKITTVGSDPSHDIQAGTQGLLFTLSQQESGTDILPANVKILVNGQAIKRATRLGSCDRIEWSGGSAVFLRRQTASAGPAEDPTDHAVRSLRVLQDLAGTLQAPSNGLGGFEIALHQILDALVEMSGAEVGYLLSDLGRDGWEMVASRQDPAASHVSRRELFSNTILQEALSKREPVSVENIIGHPWAEAASVIAARIFSAACIPLCMGERTLGAVFLFTRSPGRSIKREALAELSLIATQAALMLGTEAELKRARQENARLRTLVAQAPAAPESALVTAGAMADVARKIARLAPTPLSVLILGETGTGKEVVARELHRLSPRVGQAFVAINCAAIPATLLESTLFGHERGAFTGAVRAQAGKFSQADGGTLFLDEIGDLSLELQAKLLRAIQERQIEPLGSQRAVSVDVRLLAATHQDLEAAVRAGRFRQDLYFRLNGALLRLPPLRERGADDIAVLAQHFLRKTGSSARFAPAAVRALGEHGWPGNVRELEQVVTRAALLADGPEISAEELELGPSMARLPQSVLPDNLARNLSDAQLAFTRDFALKAIERHQGSRAQAALELGISERTLYRILSVAGGQSPGATDSLGGGV